MAQQPTKQQVKQPNQTQVKPPQPDVSQSIYGDEFQSEPDMQTSLSPTSVAMLQRTIGNQAVGQLNNINLVSGDGHVQREETTDLPSVPNLSLSSPSLQSPESASPYNLGLDLGLQLDPKIQAMMQQQVQTLVQPINLRASLAALSLGTMPSSNLNLTSSSTPEPEPPIPAGAGPDTARPATGGDLMNAILAIPAVDEALTNLQTQALDQVERDWQRLNTGEKIGTVGSVAVIGLSALGVAMGTPESREWLLDKLNGRVVPVPGLNFLHLELNTSGDNFMFGLHLDVGRLFPKSSGFGASSPQPIGAPPMPSVSIQRSANRNMIQQQSLANDANMQLKSAEALQGQIEPAVLNQAVNMETLTAGSDIFFRQSRQEGQEDKEMQMKSETAVQRQEDEEMQLKSETAVQRQEDEEMQLKGATAVQRQEDEEMQLKGATAVQRQSNEGGEISADIEQSIQSTRGSGQPLANNVRTPMENAFGTDFSDVKVHTDTQSDTLNRSLQARAFTTGQDIFFRQGEYNPGNSSGQELLAHELTHVIQQNNEAVQRKVSSKYSEIKKNLTYGLFDWIISDKEADEVLFIFENLNPTDLIETVQEMKTDGIFERFIDNLSSTSHEKYQREIKPIISLKPTASIPVERPIILPKPTGILPFGTLSSNYPLGTPEKVKQQIGGKVNYDWITNTCAIRMSRALNYSGHEIPQNGSLHTVSGADKKRYAFRVRELKQYFINQFGPAHVIHDNPKLSGIIPNDFIGVKGIIIFTVDSWSDATGHITLWDGSNCIDGTNYWNKASKVEMWIAN